MQLCSQWISSYTVLINEFVNYLIGRGLSKATSESYKHDVICFITFCHSKSLFGESVYADKLLLTHFIAWLSEKEIKRSTIQRRVMGVLAFWEFIFEEKQIGNPPMTLKRMHLKLHPSPNPTRPLNAREFAKFTEGLSNELAAIR